MIPPPSFFFFSLFRFSETTIVIFYRFHHHGIIIHFSLSLSTFLPSTFFYSLFSLFFFFPSLSLSFSQPTNCRIRFYSFPSILVLQYDLSSPHPQSLLPFFPSSWTSSFLFFFFSPARRRIWKKRLKNDYFWRDLSHPLFFTCTFFHIFSLIFHSHPLSLSLILCITFPTYRTNLLVFSILNRQLDECIMIVAHRVISIWKISLFKCSDPLTHPTTLTCTHSLTHSPSFSLSLSPIYLHLRKEVVWSGGRHPSILT